MHERASSSEIVERFAALDRDAPDRPLVHLPGRRSVTTADLHTAAAGYRARLERSGYTEGRLVISAAGNRPEAIALWLACRAADIPMMLVDASTTPSELGALASRFGAALAVVAGDAARFSTVGAVEPFPPGLIALRLPDAMPARYPGAAVLKLTSGSTGLPRATFTTEQQVLADARHVIAAMDIPPDACQLAAIPLSHAYGFGNLVMPLILQGTPIVLRDGFVPHRFLGDVTAFDVRIFPGVPFMFERLAAQVAGQAWPQRLGRLISAGARLEPSSAREFLRRFRVKIHSFYGTSETGGIAFDDSDDVPYEAAVGRPLPGVTISLRPEDGAPPGGGRVHVAGEAVSSGYADRDGPDEGFEGGGFLTGDLGRFDGRGHLVLTGRASSFINVAGRKVQPGEIEQVLRAMPGITDVHVVGVPDPVRGQVVVACYVASDADPGPLAIRQFCAARLAPYKIPRGYVPLAALPLTPRGKIDRRLIERIAAGHVGSGATGVL